ncbi:MAG: hypothetical protein EA358_07010 [Flavobacteriales bacterium]|nr:MAG: hypothetical protein EA358_07010 [Flavobacteriales bacterium]
MIKSSWAPNRAFCSKSSAKTAVSATVGKELLRRSCPLASTGVLASGLSAAIAGAGGSGTRDYKF